jgi:hypothetical protein
MIRFAAVYFIVGIALGIYMASTGNHTLMPVHAHVNPLGWLSLAVAAILYRLWPEAAATRLAKAHFVLYNAGFPIMTIALVLFLQGVSKAEPFVALGAVLLGAGVLSFTLNVLINFRSQPIRWPRRRQFPLFLQSAGESASGRALWRNAAPSHAE